MVRRFTLALAALLMLSMVATAADEPAPSAPPADTAPATEAAPGNDAAADFQKVMVEWRDLLAQLGTLQAQFKQASGPRQAEIEKQWEALIAQADATKVRLQAAAEKAYAAAPNADKQLTDLLVSILRSSLRYDDYEEALRLARLLIDNKAPEKTLPNLAGMAAYGAGDFDAAEQYFAEARKQNVLDMTGREQAATVAELKQLWAKEKAIREAEAKADDLPRIVMKTTKGDITIELFENEAPNTVANIVSLVEKGFYNGLSFHRVIPNFMAQGGDPKGDGSGGPGYTIVDELGPGYRHHFRGSLSMAKREPPHTGGSQFFLTFVPTSHLDGKHTVFGRVIEGMDVLAKLQRRDPGAFNAPAPDRITEAKVLRKRPHEYVPKTTEEVEP